MRYFLAVVLLLTMLVGPVWAKWETVYQFTAEETTTYQTWPGNELIGDHTQICVTINGQLVLIYNWRKPPYNIILIMPLTQGDVVEWKVGIPDVQASLET